MRKKLYSSFMIGVCAVLAGGNSSAQLSFINSNARLTGAAFHSGCPVTVVDWNNDGLDDLVRLDQGDVCYVDVQQANQQFVRTYLGAFNGGAWAMAVADVDHNGYKDIIADGTGGVGLLKTNNTGTGATMTWLPNSGFFLQNLTMGDFNNDGWIDIFACDDNAASHIYLNDQTGVFSESFTTIDFNLPNGSDNSGNYGSVWTDFDNDGDLDLYIAKCRQSVSSPTDPRRIDVLFVNNGNGTYTESAATYGVANGWQTWTASFGDIDNDGDLDLMATNHDFDSQIFENDGTGHYIDITASTGFDINNITPIESVMEDFDNDGFIDILVTGSNSRFYHNNGNKTFTLVTGLFDNNNMESFAIGDLNHDGWVDVYASYATIYTNPSSIDDVIWMNNGAINSAISRAMPGGQMSSVANNFFNLVLEGTTSNHDAIGARAMIYGAWGVQLREVRNGESYGTANTGTLHFGLGANTAIDSVVIKWPSGNQQTITNPSINQFLTVIEGTCVSPEALVTASGPLVLCTSGQSLTLTAPAGYSYLWSDGTTGQSVVVAQTGEYSVTITAAGNSCTATSAAVSVIPSPDQTPSIAIAGPDNSACFGSTIQIDGPAGLSSYLWSNGDTTRSINAAASGSYTLTIQGICQAFTSDSVSITIHPQVTDPTSNDVSLTTPGSATLNATGNNVSWYTSSGGAPIATGNSFTTPVLNTNTTYYMQTSDIYGGGIYPVGMSNGAGSGYPANTTNATMEFDVTKNCTLKTVKVYTNTTGVRRIELRNSANVLLNYADVNITSVDSQLVALDFALTPGFGYTLGTDGAINQTNFGMASPRLKRNSSGTNYPYTLADALNITTSSNGNQYFYYFYDWQVEKEALVCTGNFVPVNVFITVGLKDLSAEGIKMYPNPAHEQVTLETPQGSVVKANILDATSRVVKQQFLNGGKNILSLAQLATGVYQLQLIENGKIHYIKLVKN